MSSSNALPTHDQFNDLTGEVFGKLTVVSYTGQPHDDPLWTCKCECEREQIVASKDLLSGNRQHCGCSPTRRRKPGPKPMGGVWIILSTVGERRERAPSFGELVPMYVELKVRLQSLVPVELLLVDELTEEEAQRKKMRFEELLGYFLMSDKTDDLNNADRIRLVSMCVDFPPFRNAYVSRMLINSLSAEQK